MVDPHGTALVQRRVASTKHIQLRLSFGGQCVCSRARADRSDSSTVLRPDTTESTRGSTGESGSVGTVTRYEEGEYLAPASCLGSVLDNLSNSHACRNR